MATELHLLLPNFIFQIEAITPTCSYHKNNFRYFDDTRHEPDTGDGFVRRFTVDWRDSDSDIDATDHSHRESINNVLVVVFYPMIFNKDDMYEMILKDRHDLIMRLRCKDYAVGYLGNESAEIGLYNRYRTGDELNRDTDIWNMTTSWRCKVRETERP